MNVTTAPVGSLDWVLHSGGRLTAAERRSLLPALAKTHVINALGRTALLTRLNSGRRAVVPPAALEPPVSALTRAAEQVARERLSPALLNHSFRTYLFAAALGTIESLDVDRELLFAAALLHDTGLASQTPHTDFTVASARVARDIAEDVGLSSAATATMRNAITMHHNPGVTLKDGAVAYLLSAGEGLDVVGLRSWKLPAEVVANVVQENPRLGFKQEFTEAFRAESVAVPSGRARLLRRYGAFDLAIKLAPFSE
jgi:hypothetical protein